MAGTNTRNRMDTGAEPQAMPPIFGRHGPGGGIRSMGEVQKPADRVRAITRVWSYLRRQRASLITTAFLVAAGVLLNLVGPFLLGRAIDLYILKHDLHGLAKIAALMFASFMAASLVTWLQSYLMAGASQRAVRDIRNDLFTKMQVLPLQFFDRRVHGELMSRLTNDVENLNQTLSDSVAQIVSGLLSTVGVGIAMCVLNPMLAFASIGVVASLTLLLNRWIAGKTREGFRRQQASIGALNGIIEETITGQRVVKAYGREAKAIADFDASSRSLQESATVAQTYAGYVGPVMNMVNNTGLTVVAALGGYLALRGQVTVGMIATFINYTRQFGRPLNDIANLYNSIQSALAGAERVFEVIDEPAEVDVVANASAASSIDGDVVFTDVDFAYVPGVPVLRNINLHARPGQIVALIGPTGAGKTTIINLLTRFYEMDRGRVIIDGHDIRGFRKSDLRRQLGIVLQDTFLFSGSIKDNIRYGRLDATDDDVVDAARLSNADQFIHHLPHGYDTQVSERGGNLSQGQKQMLAIARAILANPRILILDEATSSVDTRTEKHIQEAMQRLMAGRTSFVIAHRLSTIRDADQILVIRGGQVTEHGTHDSLLAERGFYYELLRGPLAGDADNLDHVEPRIPSAVEALV